MSKKLNRRTTLEKGEVVIQYKVSEALVSQIRDAHGYSTNTILLRALYKGLKEFIDHMPPEESERVKTEIIEDLAQVIYRSDRVEGKAQKTEDDFYHWPHDEFDALAFPEKPGNVVKAHFHDNIRTSGPVTVGGWAKKNGVHASLLIAICQKLKLPQKTPDDKISREEQGRVLKYMNIKVGK